MPHTSPPSLLTIHAVEGRARQGMLHTRAGDVQTPAFMPVGTQATVKAMRPDDVWETGARLILNNAYHLYLRPGVEVVERLGGLHRMQGWSGAILTDSGGYQIFSLAPLHKVSEEGLSFRSHIDGDEHFMTPEKAIETQQRLGTDILMSFDQPIPWESSREQTAEATARTHRWAARGLAAWRPDGWRAAVPGGHLIVTAREDAGPPLHHPQSLFAIVQGGFEADLRRESAGALTALDFPGYGIGGLSVGEPKEVMWEMLDIVTAELPADKPRYLMGVGTPSDLVRAIALGVDMFDCVLPTRMGRNGVAFTRAGRLNLHNARFTDDPGPLDPECACRICRTFSRAYLRHLLKAQEILAVHALTYHNLFFYQALMAEIRAQIEKGMFSEWSQEFLKGYHERTSGGLRTATAYGDMPYEWR